MIRNTIWLALVASVVPALSLGCSAESEEFGSTTGAASKQKQPEIGVLLASHGDIDDIDTELEPYVKTAFLKNPGIPLPSWFRPWVASPAYNLAIGNVRDQYKVIGPTRYKANSKLQAEAVDRALQAAGLNAKTYLGYNFTAPLIEDTLAQMRADGIKKIVIFNKGAQYSIAASGENIVDAKHYLDSNKDWNVDVIGVRQYSDDPRFREVLYNAIKRDVDATFPEVPKEDMCIMIASHGLPLRLTDQLGDPAIKQMESVVSELRVRFAGYPLYHGYLNDDFFPGAKWVSPNSSSVAETMRGDGCKNILMDGRLSFTTHHRATLYDLNVVAREILEEPDTQGDGSVHPTFVPPKVVLAPNFDADPGFAKLIATLTSEFLAGKGDLEVIRKAGSTTR
jgi:ferrochelatase